MGLDFNNCDAHWSYSGFNEFRKRLAFQIGINLDAMNGFVEQPPHKGVSWDTVKDPIKLLLNHSDCDGHLTPLQCKKILPRLDELIRSWPEGDYDKVNAIELMNGMKKSIQDKKNLEFT